MSVLLVESLRKEYGALVAVNNISFAIESGQILGLIGPNGAGKTTLLRMLATDLRPTAGNARALGLDIRRDCRKVRQIIGYMPDFFNLYHDLKLCECLEFFARAYKVKPGSIARRIDEALEFVELKDKRNDMVRHLSRGMTQRFALATLLVRDPEIYLLDEPASGLDPKARIQLRRVMEKLSQRGKTVIISSHILTELSGFCSHIAIIDKGRLLVHGRVDDIEQQISRSCTTLVSYTNDTSDAEAILKKIPELPVVSVQDHTLILKTGSDPHQLAAVCRRLTENGLNIYRFARRQGSLEDIYIAVTGREQIDVQ